MIGCLGPAPDFPGTDLGRMKAEQAVQREKGERSERSSGCLRLALVRY